MNNTSSHPHSQGHNTDHNHDPSHPYDHPSPQLADYIQGEDRSTLAAQEDQQLAAIEAETQRQPYVGDLEEVTELTRDYESNPELTTKIKSLSQTYPALRRIRGDGNCFFRGFLFRLMEHLMDRDHHTEIDRLQEVMRRAMDRLVTMGFSEFILEDFRDETIDQLEAIKSTDVPREQRRARLVAVFRDRGISDSLVAYLRLITSGHMRDHADTYAPFLLDREVDEFCSREVEPMGVESDHVHVTAVTDALQVGVLIQYLDTGAAAPGIRFRDDITPAVHLLYRPGHYDVLYPRDGDMHSNNPPPTPHYDREG
eukprot:gb/GECH01010264.1/.p1 GENE.gb/GECH01010264.1/~~gb/GECH01010264.1/.p1  ORF type:complete len:312 (+),score=32.69 gb/GECH01010264.1/:1-936(+)